MDDHGHSGSSNPNPVHVSEQRSTRTLAAFAAETMQVASRAVAKAQEESRRLGVDNVYEIDGKLVWERPDGTRTDIPPELRGGK